MKIENVTEFDLMMWEMIKWLKDNPNVTLDEIGVKYEDVDTPHGKITIIKTETETNAKLP